MGDYQTAKVSIEDRTAILTFDNPPANAFNSQQWKDLEAAFDELTENDQVKVIIITAAGQIGMAGADIKEIAQMLEQQDEELAYETLQSGHRVLGKIENSSKPVIAAMTGRFWLGGGNELAMACHLRLAEDGVQIGQPEIKWAMMPGWGGTQRLPRLVGKANALEIILGGGNIKATEAYRIGLVNKVVPVGSVIREAKRWATLLSMWSAPTMTAILRSVDEGFEMSLEEGLEHESKLWGGLAETEDIREGVNSFVEKRRPKFQDK